MDQNMKVSGGMMKSMGKGYFMNQRVIFWGLL